MVERLITIVWGVALVAACGSQGIQPTLGRSGIAGQVHLGPRCPVETEGQPCADEPAAGSRVTVSRQLAGDSTAAGRVVARTTTDAGGRYRVAVAPGQYVVTASAGMSCERIDVSVREGAFSRSDISCDTGIR